MRTSLTSLVVLLATATAGGGITAELSPSDDAGDAWGYRHARLVIDNDSDDAFAAVSIHWRRGGPRLIYRAPIGPGRRHELRVALPAMNIRQTYDVSLLREDDWDAPPAVVVKTTINWPIEQVSADAFAVPSVRSELEYDAPQWSAQLRRNVMAASIIAAVVLAGIALLPGLMLRLITGVLVLSVSVTAMAWLVHSEGVVDELVLADEGLAVISSRRTVEWSSRNARLAPMYFRVDQMPAETMVVHPRLGVRMRIGAGQVRVLRLAPPVGGGNTE